MRNFLIGLYGGFDYNKFNRDYKKDFFGIEVCMFENEEDINTLIYESKKHDFKFGIHFPLRKSAYRYRDPLFLSMDREESKEAFSIFERELKFYKEINADYVLVHFPKPVILHEKFDFSSWWFSYHNEWTYEKEYPFDIFKKNCEDMFYRLSQLSQKYDIQIVLEQDAVNKYLYNGDLLEKLLEKYSNLKICLDTGRLHLLEKVDENFDSKMFVRKMAPYTYLLHLWNVNIHNSRQSGHYPILPNLNIEEGWGDIGSYLESVSKVNKDVKILFEHRSDLISDEELEKCYRWVSEYFKKL
jgi:sugar phosphate isomerase/epimerase